MATILASYTDKATFQPEKFTPAVVAQNDRVKVIIASFEPGQFIPVHRPGVDLALTVLEGEGTMVAGSEETELRAGAVAFVEAGEARGILAKTRLVILHVVTPPPTEADHAEVMAGLQRGTWK